MHRLVLAWGFVFSVAATALAGQSYSELRGRVVDEQGRIRPHMSVFLGEERLRDLDAPVPPDAEIYLVGALSGG